MKDNSNTSFLMSLPSVTKKYILKELLENLINKIEIVGMFVCSL